jgi:hypothetical protein
VFLPIRLDLVLLIFCMILLRNEIVTYLLRLVQTTIYVWILAGLIVYNLILYILVADGEDSTQLARSVYFGVICVLGSLTIGILNKFSTRKVLLSFLLASSAQAAFIYLETFTDIFSNWLHVNLVLTDHAIRFIGYGVRAIGLTNSGGSALSVTQALGAGAGLLLLLSKRSSALGETLGIIFALLLLLGSTFLTGRTGTAMILMFIVFFLVLASVLSQRLYLIMIVVLFVILGYSLGPHILNYLLSYFPALGPTLEWNRQLLDIPEARLFYTLGLMSIPELSIETIVGTGLVFDGFANVSGSDIGYIQNYYAMGLIMTLVFYLATLFFLVSRSSRMRPVGFRVLFLFFAAIMFVVEIKEPFMFKYNYPMFLFALLWCQQFARKVEIKTQA